MKSRRTIILIVAVALGALAAVGLLSYVQNAQDSAGEANSTVDVWVVAQPIPKGTPAQSAIEQGLLAKEQTAAKLSPSTAVIDPDAELAGFVAVADLPIGMPIVTGTFASPSVVNTGITDRLEGTGLTTATFTVDPNRGVAHLIEPGDFVNVMVERPWEAPFWEEDPPVDLTENARAELEAILAENDDVRPILTDVYPVDARFVYHKAEVLAVGEALTPDLGEQVPLEGEEAQVQNKSLITLMVPPEVTQIILGADRDKIYLTLVPDDYEPRAIQPLDPTTQVLPGEDSARLTPYIGFDGVQARDRSTDGLQFGDDGESRIGQTPGSGSQQTETDTGGDTESSANLGESTDDTTGGGDGFATGGESDQADEDDPDAEDAEGAEELPEQIDGANP